MKQILVTILLASFGSVLALWSLWSSSYLPAFHDQYQAERVYEFSQSLAFGQFPVRYVLDLGFGLGYPLFNYYAPFPYFLASCFYLLGFNLIVSTKLMISLLFIVAFFSMYYTVRSVLNHHSALLGAILYSFAPYHAVQLYVRGSIGELATYALLPLAILGFFEIKQLNPNFKKIQLSIFATSIIYISHTLSILMCLQFIALCLILSFIFHGQKLFSKYKLKLLTFWLIMPILLSAFFIMPAFAELKYTSLDVATGNSVDFRDHFIDLTQVWDSPWGFGGSTIGNTQDGMSFMLGKVSIVFAIAVLFSLFFHSKIKHKESIKIFALLSIIFIFLTNQSSQFLWEILPYQSLIQFPWRYLMIESFILCFIASYFLPQYSVLINSYFPQIKKFYTGFLLLLICYLQLNNRLLPKFFYADTFYLQDSTQISNPHHLQTVVSQASNEFMPNGVNLSQLSSLQSVECNSLCLVRADNYTPDRYDLQVTTNESTQLTIPKAYFPGFFVTINDQPGQVLQNNGLLSVYLPTAGDYHITFQLLDTFVRLLANVITVTTILGIIILKLTKSYVRN